MIKIKIEINEIKNGINRESQNQKLFFEKVNRIDKIPHQDNQQKRRHKLQSEMKKGPSLHILWTLKQ